MRNKLYSVSVCWTCVTAFAARRLDVSHRWDGGLRFWRDANTARKRKATGSVLTVTGVSATHQSRESINTVCSVYSVVIGRCPFSSVIAGDQKLVQQPKPRICRCCWMLTLRPMASTVPRRTERRRLQLSYSFGIADTCANWLTTCKRVVAGGNEWALATLNFATSLPYQRCDIRFHNSNKVTLVRVALLLLLLHYDVATHKTQNEMI